MVGHTLIQIQSYLFVMSQPKVSFQFLIFRESSYMVHVFTSTYHFFFIQSHILRLQMGSTTFKRAPIPRGIKTNSILVNEGFNDKHIR